MTDHPAPNPNQPNALVEEVHAKVVDEHYAVMDSVRRGKTNIVDNSRRCHCGHPLPWAGHELAMERHRLAMALAAVLPEAERHAKADAWDEASNEALRRGWIDNFDQIDMRWANPYREKGDDRG